ncbi:biotin/lipoyl-containing protein, partial [Streptomyces hirsutus]|uniref:biotin/lipoyl-containing protein n=1 Tax=Streptomyces hirsutus TaxID=35620 RepID=UPI0033D60AA7
MTTMTQAPVREFKMPDVGEGLTEAEILKWYVQPGDTVTDGQVVCEVETAKAAVELPIPYDGVVRALHFPEGTTVDVGRDFEDRIHINERSFSAHPDGCITVV